MYTYGILAEQKSVGFIILKSSDPRAQKPKSLYSWEYPLFAYKLVSWIFGIWNNKPPRQKENEKNFECKYKNREEKKEITKEKKKKNVIKC